jgi:AraC-like DNA-binding protein
MATFSAFTVANLVGFAASRGVDGAALARDLGLTREILGDPEERVPVVTLYALWESLMRELDDPALPIDVARTHRVEDLHVMGFAVMTSATIREAVRRAIRYFTLLSDSGVWSLDEGDEAVRVRWYRGGELRLGLRLANEVALAVFAHVFRQLLGREVPIAATFRHAGPADIRAHRRFFDGGLEFAAGEDSLSLPRDTFDLVPRDANPKLSAFFAAHAESLMPRYESATIADRVRAEFARELASGQPAMADVARRLGTSERSLRRQLEAETLSFRDLAAEVLRDRARELLRRTDSSVTDIAFQLGFSDSSAFTRACKRWFGQTPRELRAG